CCLSTGYAPSAAAQDVPPGAREAARRRDGPRLTDTAEHMFESIANVVTRRGWIILLGWLVFSVTLFWFAPPWERVSRDDDVRFFPAGYPSVVGQELLERGFPQDAASSQLVVIGERRRGPLGRADFAFLDQRLVPLLNQAREREPRLGIKRIDTHLTPVIG